MSIGLKRGEVKVEPHSREWDLNAKRTLKKLRSILGDDMVDAAHIGSTSIESICAKPIIDLAVAVRKFDDIRKHDKKLAENGFIYRGEDIPGQILYVCGNFKKDTRTHHIHVVIAASDDWLNYIDVRDYLRCHDEDAKAYSDLKRELSRKYGNDRIAYTNAKSDMINGIIAKAKDWRENGDLSIYTTLDLICIGQKRSSRPKYLDRRFLKSQIRREGDGPIYNDRYHFKTFDSLIGVWYCSGFPLAYYRPIYHISKRDQPYICIRDDWAGVVRDLLSFYISKSTEGRIAVLWRDEWRSSDIVHRKPYDIDTFMKELKKGNFKWNELYFVEESKKSRE